MKKVLVTGAAGFLGSHLCDKLLKEGYHVIGVDNFFRGKKNNLPVHENFEFYNHDLSKEKIKGLESINLDYVYHYAAINGTKYFYDIPNKVLNDNIKITQNTLSSLRSQIKKIFYASSSEVYGPTPKVPTKEEELINLNIDADRDSYASSKAIGEFLIRSWCKENKVSYIILRPFNTYGKRMATDGYGQVIPEFIERVNQGENFYLFGNGSQTRSFCYVKDHVNIAVKLLETCENQVLNIGFDEEISINDLAKKIHFILNKKFVVENKPAWENDTKWRKPSLIKLRKYIGNYRFTNLEEGLRKILDIKLN